MARNDAAAAIGETGDPFASQLDVRVSGNNLESLTSRTPARRARGLENRRAFPDARRLWVRTCWSTRSSETGSPQVTLSSSGLCCRYPRMEKFRSRNPTRALTAKDRAFDRSCHSPNEIARLPFVSCFLRVASQRSRAASRRRSELAPLEPSPPQIARDNCKCLSRGERGVH